MTETLVQLAPVVVGGVLATLGGAAAQYMTHHFSQQRERAKLLHDKAELLIRMIYCHRDYVTRCHDHSVFGEEEVKAADPLEEMQTLARLYFPSVAKEEVELIETVQPMFAYMHKHRLARMKDADHWRMDRDGQEFKRLYGEYGQASNRYIKAILDLVPRKM